MFQFLPTKQCCCWNDFVKNVGKFDAEGAWNGFELPTLLLLDSTRSVEDICEERVLSLYRQECDTLRLTVSVANKLDLIGYVIFYPRENISILQIISSIYRIHILVLYWITCLFSVTFNEFACNSLTRVKHVSFWRYFNFIYVYELNDHKIKFWMDQNYFFFHDSYSKSCS